MNAINNKPHYESNRYLELAEQWWKNDTKCEGAHPDLQAMTLEQYLDRQRMFQIHDAHLLVVQNLVSIH